MKKHTRKINHKEEGITLIALVVTIIVLLILAGVTLNLVLGENGLIGRAQQASNTMAEATRNELASMAEMEDVIARLSQNREDNTDYSELLYEYYKDMDDDQIVEERNIIDGTDANWLFGGEDEEDCFEYIEYRGGIYKIIFIDDSWNGVREVEKVDTSNVDFNTFGVYQIDGINVLITPDDPDRLIHGHFIGPEIYGTYYLKENGDLDLERPFAEGYFSENNGYFYDMSGKKVNVIEVNGPNEYNGYCLKENGDLDLERPFTEGYYDWGGYHYDMSGKKVNVLPFVSGPQTFSNCYYLKENGDLDLERPFAEGYFSANNGRFYDITGKKVNVGKDLPPLD